MKSAYLADKFLAKVLANEDFTVTNIYVGLMAEVRTMARPSVSTTAVPGRMPAAE